MNEYVNLNAAQRQPTSYIHILCENKMRSDVALETSLKLLFISPSEGQFTPLCCNSVGQCKSDFKRVKAKVSKQESI